MLLEMQSNNAFTHQLGICYATGNIDGVELDAFGSSPVRGLQNLFFEKMGDQVA